MQKPPPTPRENLQKGEKHTKTGGVLKTVKRNRENRGVVWKSEGKKKVRQKTEKAVTTRLFAPGADRFFVLPVPKNFEKGERQHTKF